MLETNLGRRKPRSRDEERHCSLDPGKSTADPRRACGAGSGSGAGVSPRLESGSGQEGWWQDGDSPSVLAERRDPVRPFPKVAGHLVLPGFSSTSLALQAEQLWGVSVEPQGADVEPTPILHLCWSPSALPLSPCRRWWPGSWGDPVPTGSPSGWVVASEESSR